VSPVHAWPVPEARSRRTPRWLALVATLVAVVATLTIPSPASAGTSYFPTIKITTGSGQGVNIKAGVYVYEYNEFAWTKTYATSFGSQNHRVDFALVKNGIRFVSYYHPNVGTGTWEDCLGGTNTNCPGTQSGSPAYLQVTVSNLSTGTCRTAYLSSAAMNTTKQWGTPGAC
jgi:hypothetical protein